MANINSKYDSFIHFTVKFNSKDYSIYFFSGIFNSKNYSIIFFPRKFNSKIDSNILIWLNSIHFNKIFIQLENQGIDHYNSNESMGFNDPKEFDDTQVFDDLNFNWKYGLS